MPVLWGAANSRTLTGGYQMAWFTNSKFAFCRGIANHAWQFPPKMDWHGRQLLITLHCQHCEAKRRDHVSAFNGEVTTRSYDYADGYLLDLQGKKRPPKHNLRRDGLQLLLETVKGYEKRETAPRKSSRRRAVA